VIKADEDFTMTVNGSIATGTGTLVLMGWADAAAERSPRTIVGGVSLDAEFTALYGTGQTDPRLYFITATSDGGSKVSPQGRISVLKGSSQTFTFSALDGYAINAVLVNGNPISQTDLSRGSFTFRDVNANHTIDVYSRDIRTGINLSIVVSEGNGYAMYSVNGSEFTKYTTILYLDEGDNVVLTAHPESGNEFKQWRDGGRIFTEQEIGFPDLHRSVHLELYFKDERSPIWVRYLVVDSGLHSIAASGSIPDMVLLIPQKTIIEHPSESVSLS
jgi:hypothetical protein